LELAYLRRVERAHGLPAAGRQVARARRGGRWYDDVHYRRLATLVELDGSAAHPAEWGRQDNHRDNAGVVAGFAVLRYQVADVLDAPCAVAGQVARVLRRNGWRGSPRRCGPDCMIAEDLGTGDYPDLP
jgi:very-short-patch-repair endonuclease